LEQFLLLFQLAKGTSTMVQILGILIALAGLSFLLYTLERLFPSVRGQPLWRQDSRLDLLYWLFTPLVTRTISKTVSAVGVVIVLAALGWQIGPRMTEGFGPVVRQSWWLLLTEMLLVGDLIGYWTHRWFHRQRLWTFHAVHHSSTQLDWLSALRVHPVNDVVSKFVPAVSLACLGFPLKALAGYVPLLTFYAILLHANVNWSFGPLRHVIASPLFHRWHHTTEEQGLNKNFAPLLPFIDWAFGTFYMPQGLQPKRFGTSRTKVPETFLGQLLFPFRGEVTVAKMMGTSPMLDLRRLLAARTRKVNALPTAPDATIFGPVRDRPSNRTRRSDRSDQSAGARLDAEHEQV
jgi:sterol desaturase/sphingolipid hydroxylase (fatty acid hydroxylase superfamily)